MADEQATKEAPKGAVEAVKNCAGCNKPMKKAKKYYRNGKYYCNQKCYNKTAKAAKAEQLAQAEQAKAEQAKAEQPKAEPAAPSETAEKKE